MRENLRREFEEEINRLAISFKGNDDLEELIEKAGDKKVVMLGEATHGTHEFYNWRAKITKRLIEEKGFNIIGVEGDWPDCYEINRYIKNYEDSGDNAAQVLKGFNRWPAWMWSNWEIVELTEWLRKYNDGRKHKKAGFYGLDVYSLWESMDALYDFLKERDPKGAEAAKEAMLCFEPFEREPGDYARSLSFVPEGCEKEVTSLLARIRANRPEYRDGEYELNVLQNAEVIANAEKYYRAMISGGMNSWNVRDTHMNETISRLIKNNNEKIIVWAHNTHIGDARATDMKRSGSINIGQLARETFGDENVFLLGLGMYRGTVIAGDSWGAQMKVMNVPESREASFDQIVQSTGNGDCYMIFDDNTKALYNKTEQRAIGVVYNPGQERFGNYVPSVIAQRYDAYMFFDNTEAVYPMQISADSHKEPETYPWGI
ncbi:MAG: erythromycin esterase family protein [Bacteroidota bacterium]